MKKLLFSLFTLLTLIVLGVGRVSAQEDQYLRIGTDAAFAPFSWTQSDDSNGAIPIEGTNQYANGYDVQVAKKIAEQLGKTPVVVKTDFTGLIPALTSGKVDLIIAGMSPTEERRLEIDFSDTYYRSEPVLVVRSDSDFAKAKTLSDFAGAKITSQQGTYLYGIIDQIQGAKQETAMGDFSQIRQALLSGIIDAYVTDRPDGVAAEVASKQFKMIVPTDGFEVSSDDVDLAIGIRKGQEGLKATVNQVLANIPDQQALMDQVVPLQPVTEEADQKPAFLAQVWSILTDNWQALLSGTAMTLFIAITSTLIGSGIGFGIGVFRTAPAAQGSLLVGLQKAVGWLINTYVQIFRGTPMIVQSMVIYYGTAQAFGISLDRTLAAILIVAINTGAYMSETIRGAIHAVDKGQFEAATALGFTHRQTMIKVVLPQVFRYVLPSIGNEFVLNIKDTSVLNVISVVELYFTGNTVATQTYQYFQTFTLIAAIYFILTLSVTYILRLLEKFMDADDYTGGTITTSIGGTHD